MTDSLYIAISFSSGMLLGTFFFGGLWFTVKRAFSSRMPALWFLGSFVIRIGITLAGFYFIGSENWRGFAACMVGFVVSRFIIVRYTKLLDDRKLHLNKEVRHGA
ncbi:MAG: ATP synthase subunit I [Chryseolinea sp.]